MANRDQIEAFMKNFPSQERILSMEPEDLGKLGIKEVDDGIWLVNFMHDLGYFDLEQKTLQIFDNPFGPKAITNVSATTQAP